MTTEQTIKEILTLLKVSYPNSFKDISKEEALLMIKVWYSDFKETRAEDLKMAVDRIRYKNKFMPSIAEIKSEVATIKNKELQINAEDEWEKVLTAIRRWGTLERVAFEKITEETIHAMGIRRLELIETANIPYMKKEFIEIWNNKRDGIEHAYIQNSNTLTYREQLLLDQQEEDRLLLELETYGE